MGLKKKVTVVVMAFLCGGVLLAAPAAAAVDNYGKSWETWHGAKWNGHVQIRASYSDGGRHAKQGYHRFQRKAGPTLDTGRMYTSTASSREDRTVRSREDSVWDSPLWGDKYTTRYNYNFIYF